jgi:hypothetical protein
MNNFGWFMSGCYVTSFLTAIILDTTFVVPTWVYFVLILGLSLTILLERKEVLNGIARYIKQGR